MKLREEEFYEQYHQHGGTTIIPTEIFNELYDDATEEIERLNNRVSELEKAVSRKEEQITDLDDENFDLENEIERLNNIIKEVRNQLDYLETYSSKEDVFEDMKRRLDRIDKIIGSDKE